jgi:hypothetical protein
VELIRTGSTLEMVTGTNEGTAMKFEIRRVQNGAVLRVEPDYPDAEAIALQIYGRYRRTPNTDVLRELFALRQSDGTPAVGNPLWLTLTLDLLNLLDADDFSAAEATVGGSPEEKLRRLVLNRARTLPPDMEGLYGQLLAQVEKVAGLAETRAFAALTALGRRGWREEDLQHLLPKAAELLAQFESTAARITPAEVRGPTNVFQQKRCWETLGSRRRG